MTSNHRTVFVTGATGKQGGSVVRHMLGGDWNLRALTRDSSSRAARVLADQGVELVQGDLDDPRSFEAALRGAYGVYSVQDFWSIGAKREVMQGKNLAESAKKAGVEHFVYSSVGGAERNTGIDHWESKWEIEKHIRKLGLCATVLRPVAFMEGYYSEPLELAILQGKLVHPVRADKPYQTIATDDIGGFVALAFERPKEFIGLELELAGSELTNPEAAQVFSRVLGKPVEFVPMPIPAEKEYSQMFNWFNNAGFQANIASLRNQYSEARLQTLEEWLYNEGWHKRVRRITPPEHDLKEAHMQTTRLHDDVFFDILWDEKTEIIGIQWKEATSSMTEQEFKSELERFAGYVEARKARGILVDVAHFRQKMSPGVSEWRVKNISPRYSAAGVRRFAFLFPEGAPIPPMMNQSAPGESFATRGFDHPDDALTWLSGAD